jgi:hypothetical protein
LVVEKRVRSLTERVDGFSLHRSPPEILLTTRFRRRVTVSVTVHDAPGRHPRAARPQRAAASRAGHCASRSADITLKIYAHTNLDAMRAAVKRLDDQLD